ncbi:DUF2637 domain-containing protein [Microlunatus speluncae]|uniref:DUF2637 domain-containing protein n=1 Tax=Microlunatus speluncae TaxID=2594267 RepID=UPI0012660965|nr:DUF2637 domain-containing protein [Microlunatus speluncae]
MIRPPGRSWAVTTAVAGTVFIAAGAFWLSFTSLADLATRSGIDAGQAWAWPLIVDGIIVTATVAVVALAGDRAAWYPWALLIGGASVSVTANALHAVVAADVSVPPVLAASVASVPPVVLLAITHLTVILTQREDRPWSRPSRLADISLLDGTSDLGGRTSAPTDADADRATDGSGRIARPKVSRSIDSGDRRARALALRHQGWRNKAIARELSVHPSTIGRWFAHLDQRQAQNTDPSEAKDSKART